MVYEELVRPPCALLHRSSTHPGWVKIKYWDEMGRLLLGVRGWGSHMDHITRVDASSDFNGTANVPKIAITMGFLLFCCRRELFCWLGGKTDIIKEQFRKTSALKFPYVLQNHANTTFV
jgi:hypothetical protein